MKNPAAVALGRKGGKKGGVARAALMTPEQRSQSARKAVMARWSRRAGTAEKDVMTTETKREIKAETSDDKTLILLLNRIKATSDLNEIRELSEQIERVIFHKQEVK